MRQGDAVNTQAQYRRIRSWQAAYGTAISLIGFALMLWMPGAEWIRLSTGWLVVLLGGMMVSPQTVKDWFALVGEVVPFFRPLFPRRKP